MDDKAKNEYIKSLPSKVQDLVFDDAWENRTTEVGKKYSLNDTQIDSLCDNVLIILIGLEDPNKLLENIIIDLGISRLLAEQIESDLEKRVFEYALKIIGEKDNTPKNSAQTTQSRTPETKPDNLPAVEIGEKAHNTTAEEKKFFESKPAEPVKRPYSPPPQASVPRYGLGQVPPKVEVINLNQSKPTNPQNMMASKMNNVTVNMGDNFAPSTPKPQTGNEPPKMPSTKYAVDPYREPLE